MSLPKKTSPARVSSDHKSLLAKNMKVSADSTRMPLYSKELKEKGISKNEFFKMLALIQEEERTRIGHELHDGVNPLLSLAKLYLEFVHAKTAKEKFAKNQVGSVILSAIENIRSISSQLVISEKTNCNIIQLINDLISKINDSGIFKISFRHSSEHRLSKLSAYIRLAIYRIIQEQLNNIIKHSKAGLVEVRLFWRKGMISLLISDDGVGFDTTKATSGIGLTNISSRVSQFNGIMKITSMPGKGCTLHISLSDS
jgi:signal transduction histidine kinase